jgi:hypothetical protein
MIERAIENWLSRTNERNYQAAFCQTLMHKGHRVIYYSTHRPMEQGKDIVTVDAGGSYCGFQLKTGSIDLPKWREIVGEVKELIELPIVHPSVDKSKVHKSYLVTNGEITDEVRFQIDQINDDNQRKGRGYSRLDVITLSPLLRDFIDAQGKFMPRELSEFRQFLELLMADGTDFLDKEKLFSFFDKSVFAEVKRTRADAANVMGSSVIITAYLLNPFQQTQNYYAQFEGWTCLAASIVRYLRKAGLPADAGRAPLALAMEEIVSNLTQLRTEALNRQNFMEGAAQGDGGLMYKARVTLTLSALAALELHLKSIGKTDELDARLPRVVKENLSHFWFWGESALPCLFSIVKYLEINSLRTEAEALLNKVLHQISHSNAARQGACLPNPCYSVTGVLEAELGIDDGRLVLENFSGSSYALHPVIQMMARRNMKATVSDLWRSITHIQFQWFEADAIEDYFSWNTRDGANRSTWPNQTQGWAALVQEAQSKTRPVEFLSEYRELIRFFILACPHRADAKLLGLLDT